MGLWLNDAQIQKIVAKLDFKFSDTANGINKIRTTTRRNRFDAGGGGGARKLHKIARQMRIWGDNGGPGTPHSKRWWGFLKGLHAKANNAPGGTADCAEDIKTYIRRALDDDPACVAIKFAAVEGADVRVTPNKFYLREEEPEYIALIVLQTVAHDGTQEPNPGPGGEDPESEDPMAPGPTVAAGAPKMLASKKAARKSAKKKAAKKKTAGKKAAKKKRGR